MNKKIIFTALFALVFMPISAQKIIVQDLESWMSGLISRAIDYHVDVNKSLGQERDLQ